MMSPISYPGQDIEHMTMDYTKLYKELKVEGFFDHNLKLSIVNGLLQPDAGDQTCLLMICSPNPIGLKVNSTAPIVWGCPIYVLDKTIADRKKIPKWEKRSAHGMYMGMSPKHASSVPLVLNLETGSITPQFQFVFDNWFATVSTDEDALPDFKSDEWLKMFGDSAYQYMIDEDDKDTMDTINGIPDLGHQT